jgi:hypothetical protein
MTTMMTLMSLGWKSDSPRKSKGLAIQETLEKSLSSYPRLYYHRFELIQGLLEVRTTFEEYPENMKVETLLTFKCRSFELTGDAHISVSCLQNPTGYANHKCSLGMMGKGSKERKE